MSLSPNQDQDFHKKWSSMYAVGHGVKYRVDSCDARWCLCSEGQCQLLPAACVLKAPSCGVQRMSSLVSVPLSSCVFLLRSPVAFWFVFSFFIPLQFFLDSTLPALLFPAYRYLNDYILNKKFRLYTDFRTANWQFPLNCLVPVRLIITIITSSLTILQLPTTSFS